MLDGPVIVTGGCVILPRCNADRTWASIDIEPESMLGAERCRRLDPLSQVALVAVERAREQADLRRERGRAVSENEGVIVGSALAATATSVRYARRLVSAGPATTNPIDFPDSIDGAPAAHVALDLGLGGVSLTISDGERSAVHALVHAARLVAWGRATRMYVVVGDRCDPFFAEAIAREGGASKRDQSVHGQGNPSETRCWAECVLALLLERRSAADTAGIELLGHLPEPDVVHQKAEETRTMPGWTMDPSGLARLSRTNRPTTMQDPSGALELAAAWLNVAGPMSRVIGAHEPEVPAPFAECVSCGREFYPNLRFVQRRGQ